jgi:DnaJ domain
MPCACAQCVQHARTLGLAQAPPSKAAIHKAYRKAAKQWHPDRFERNPGLQPEAEERFKLVQIAYRELSEHHEHPAELPLPTIFTKPVPTPPFSFGNAPGCFTGPHFPAHVERLIENHLGLGHTALAIVDLSRPGPHAGSFSQFLLLDNHAVIVRNPLGIVSLLWYSDLGDVRLIDRRRHGKLNFWQKLADKITGPRPNYTFKIYRRNGAHFCSLAGPPDDSVKKVIYNFLLRRKFAAHP